MAVELDDIKQLRSQIEDALLEVSYESVYSKKDVLKIVEDKGHITLSMSQLDYMLELNLCPKKVIEKEERNSYRFGRNEITQIILVCRLKDEYKLSYAQILGLFLENCTSLSSQNSSQAKDLFTNFPSQSGRAGLLCRSRIFGIVLHWFLGEAYNSSIQFLFRVRADKTQKYPNQVDIRYETATPFDADKYIGLIRKDDVIGYISPDPDREVLHSNVEYKSILDFGLNNWILISVISGQPYVHYDLAVGFQQPVNLEKLCDPKSSTDKKVIGLLLKAATLKFEAYQKRPRTDVRDVLDYSTMLDAIVEKIPDLSEKWQYCLALAANPDDADNLRVIAYSEKCPLELRQNIKNLSVEAGQPLTGWAFGTNYLIKVNQTLGERDPRLAYQNLEKAVAAVAIPTRTQGIPNGVLYIGTDKEDRSDSYHEVFTEEELRLLIIFGDIVGEVIERTRTRKKSESSLMKLIDRPPTELHRWYRLQETIEKALESALKQDADLWSGDTLHLTLIRIGHIEELHQRYPVVSGWLCEHVVNTTREYFLSNFDRDPTIYTDDLPLAQKFACILTNYWMTDEADREHRGALSELLSSLSLVFGFGNQLDITVDVWTMKYRYGELHGLREADRGKKEIIRKYSRKILKEVEDALNIIPYIEDGHRHERDGAYALALEQYRIADLIASNNRYVLRHIAKTYHALRMLPESIEWWEKLLAMEDNWSYRLAYAQVLAQSRRYDEAAQNYAQAYIKNPDNLDILLEWGDLLSLLGQPIEAIVHFEKALKVAQDHRDRFWMRIAQNYFDAGNYDVACRTLNEVLDRNPNDYRARHLSLKIKRALE